MYLGYLKRAKYVILHLVNPPVKTFLLCKLHFSLRFVPSWTPLKKKKKTITIVPSVTTIERMKYIGSFLPHDIQKVFYEDIYAQNDGWF